MVYRIFFGRCYTNAHNKAMRYIVENLRGAEWAGEGFDEERGDYVDVLAHTDYQKEIESVFQALSDADCLYFEEREG